MNNSLPFLREDFITLITCFGGSLLTFTIIYELLYFLYERYS
jgi:hypothetical protein